MNLVQTGEWEISDIENQISYLLDFILRDGVSRSVLSAKRWFSDERAHIAHGEYAHHAFAAMRELITAPALFRIGDLVRIKDGAFANAGQCGEIIGINPITEERIVYFSDKATRQKYTIAELEAS